MKNILMKRLISFVDKIRKSRKPVLKQLWDISVGDVRSITGKNMRNILMLTNKMRVEDITRTDVEHIKYHPLGEEDRWTVLIIQEILDMRNGEVEIPGGWNSEYLTAILDHACTS